MKAIVTGGAGFIGSPQFGNEYYYIFGEDFPGNSQPSWRYFKVNMETFKDTLEWMLGGP